MTFYEIVYFLVHCLVHLFGYWIPCALGACADVLMCRPCHTCEKKKHGYAYHPAREVRLIHHPQRVEAAVHVFGLMDVHTSALEDRQYCALAVSEVQNTGTVGPGKPEMKSAQPSAKEKEWACSKSTSTKVDGEPSAPFGANANRNVPASRSPLEPSPQASDAQDLDDADTYNSQRYPHLSSSARTSPPQWPPPPANRVARHHPSKSEAGKTTATTTAAVTAMKKALHTPSYTPPDKKMKKEIQRCHLTYDAPLYGPHIGTILGAFRPHHPIDYVREEMQAWDGCYLAMDWYYVEGEAPMNYDHTHTSRQRLAEEAAAAAAAAAAASRNEEGSMESADAREMHNEPFFRAQWEGAGVSSSAALTASQEVRQSTSAESDLRGAPSAAPAAVASPHAHPPETQSAPGSGSLNHYSDQENRESTVCEGGVADRTDRNTTLKQNDDHALPPAATAAFPAASAAQRPRDQQPTSTTPLKKTAPSCTAPSGPPPQTSASAGARHKAVGVVFIVPGLTSYAQSNYVQHLVDALHKAHLHVCVLTTRGMGDSPPITTPFLFNGAYTRDVRDCLQHFLNKDALTARLGRPFPLIGVGLSIGGAILSKYVGEEGIAGADPHLDALICCCSPMDYVMTVEHMNRNGAQRAVYQHDMCNDVRSYLLRHPPLQHMPNVDNDWVFVQGNIHRFRRVLHFDEHVIAPSAGYRSAHHYHIDASAATWLPYTPIPVLAMSAADDPVIGRTVMPHRWREMIENNPRLLYAEPPVGGHLGFLGNPWAEVRNKDNWMEVFVRDRVLAACEYWHAVQQKAKEVRHAQEALAAAASAPSPSSPGMLFSPTTETGASALASMHAANAKKSTAAVEESPTSAPSFTLMKVVPEFYWETQTGVANLAASTSLAVTIDRSDLGKAAHEGQARDGEGRGATSVFVEPPSRELTHGVKSAERPADTRKDSLAKDDTSAFSRCAVDARGSASHAPADGLADVLTPDAVLQHNVAERAASATSHTPHKAVAATAAAAAAAALPSASPRPIQYLPPREDRPTNRCYFTYYCTPAVPPQRLHQPYFTPAAPLRANDGANDLDDTDEYTSLSTATTATGLDDGRSSMYATGSGGGGGGNGGRRRSTQQQQHQLHDYEMSPCVAPAAGKDPRCMMMTGQNTYAPVVVNCDYAGDPRTMMLAD